MAIIYYLKKCNLKKHYEREAKWELMHVVFGIGLASFFSFTFPQNIALKGVIVGVLGYEIVEEIRMKTFTRYPIDTVLDIILGIGAGWLYLYWQVF
jgi:hypothetical protein